MNKSSKGVFLYQPSGRKPIIFCFHHAGGSTSVYRSWHSCKNVDMIPVELPGHGCRISEELTSDIDLLSIEIAASIAELLKHSAPNCDFSLFGHSLGAIIAFNVADILIHKHGLTPVCLQVAGRHAPQDEDPSPYRTYMGTEPLLETIRDLGQTPPELLENEEFKSFLLPIIFSDYALSESFVYRGKRISVPILAYCGNDDCDANKPLMNRWQAVTTGKFQIKDFNGGHFFLLNEALNFQNILAFDMQSMCSTKIDDRYNIMQFVAERTVKYERGTI